MTTNWPPEPASSCPLNNFGRGVDYTPTTDEERTTLITEWEAWETEHPDDPDGAIYLEQYKVKLAELQNANPAFFVTGNKEISEKTKEIVKNGKPGRPRTSEGEKTRLTLYFSASLLDAFAIKCNSNGISMSKAVTAFAESYIES